MIVVDPRSKRAWLTVDDYEQVIERSEKREQFPNQNPLFAGALGWQPGAVLLYKVEVADEMPPLEEYVVETTVTGLFSYVEWLNEGEPGQNPLVQPPVGSGTAIKAEAR